MEVETELDRVGSESEGRECEDCNKMGVGLVEDEVG